MIYLLLDTSVYISIAGGAFPELLDKLIEAIESDEIVVLANEVIQQEWINHKDDTRYRIINKIKGETASAKRLMYYLTEDIKRAFEAAIHEYESKENIRISAAESIITKVEDILFRKSLLVKISERVKIQIISMAVDKKAPFHNKANSVADALTFFSTVDFVKTGHHPDDYQGIYFIANNPDDFSKSKKEDERNQIHSDLKPFADEIQLKYSTNLSEVLRISDELAKAYWDYVMSRLEDHWEFQAEIERGK
jgi:PIN domain